MQWKLTLAFWSLTKRLYLKKVPNGRFLVLTLPQGLSRPFRAQDSGGACPRQLRAFQALAGGRALVVRSPLRGY